METDNNGNANANSVAGKDTDPNDKAPSLNEVLEELDKAEAEEDGTSTTTSPTKKEYDDDNLAIEAAITKTTLLIHHTKLLLRPLKG